MPEEIFNDDLFGDLNNDLNDEILVFETKKEKYSKIQTMNTEQAINPDQAWKVLIVDDEQDVHTVTRIALKGFEYESKRIFFLDAYSAREAKKALVQHKDIAVILLDVIMESNDAGLELVKYIREELKNNAVRIILRTGHPGQVPEKKIIVEYEINDYKTKVELTSVKLFTTIVACLRSYNSIVNLEIYKNKLEEKVKSRTAEISQNIHYAKRIQKAILPSEELLLKNFGQYFYINIPKDHISGDFLWVSHKDNKTVLAVADCTGLGVSGAFMSLLGSSFLADIIQADMEYNQRLSFNAAQILERLRDKMKHSFPFSGNINEPGDSIDIALCVINKSNRTIDYAGAYNPLYLIRKGNIDIPASDKYMVETSEQAYSLMQIKGDQMPISSQLKEKESFVNHTFEYLANDRLVMFTDGYINQTGGENGEKLMESRFRKFLLNIQKQPLSEQKNSFLLHLNNWQKNLVQTDDILVVGIEME